ncbi:MauE/DoxX family redox-associated membrane protein [Sphaerisporangium fuscum]|uniref:MauE/DoxX family redox-associated membrane protein n=1 Tax=Sphaerisporangium fuscum TaxID=2835868 RepID=UPI001BDD6E5A|nr:MauE/DoxX family redox-associated membrane protein [Sphaerisporangium fuscum]
MEYVRIGCACLVALVFAITAVSKLRDFEGFRRSLPQLVPVRRPLLRPIAVAVVATEALIPILIAVPPLTPYGLALAGALLVAFTAAIALALRRGQRAPCRCFGASAAPLGARHLVRNALLIVVAALGALLPAGVPVLAGTALAVVAGLIGAMIIASFDDIVDLFARNA